MPINLTANSVVPSTKKWDEDLGQFPQYEHLDKVLNLVSEGGERQMMLHKSSNGLESQLMKYGKQKRQIDFQIGTQTEPFQNIPLRNVHKGH